MALHSGKRITIGFLIPNLLSEYFQIQYFAINQLAMERDVNLIVFSPFMFLTNVGLNRDFIKIFEFVGRENVDGVLVSSGSMRGYFNMKELTNLFSSYGDLPIVSLGEDFPGIPSVLIDNKRGMFELVEHFITAHHYQRIAFIKGTQNNHEAELRFSAYVEALNRHGIPFDRELMYQGDFGFHSGQKAVQFFYREKKLAPEAIIAANDDMVLGAYSELTQMKIKIPGQIALGGFDNIKAVREINPPVTTVRQPIDEQCRRGLDTILAILIGKQVPDKEILPAHPIIRRSCGCTVSEKPGTGGLPARKKEYEYYRHIGRKENIKKYEMTQEGYNIGFISEFSTNIMNNLNIDNLKDQCEPLFQKLGLLSCFMHLYRGGIPLFSDIDSIPPAEMEIIFAYVNGRRIPEMETKRLSNRREITPTGDDTARRRHSTVMSELVFQNEHYGLLAVEMEIINPLAINLVKQQVTNCLHNIHIHRQLENAMSKIEESNEKLKGLDKLKNDFIANITHDFRSPLSVILNIADLDLKTKVYNESNLRHIYDASFRLKKTIDRLLEIAKLDALGVRLRIKKIDPAAFLKRIILFYSSSVTGSGIKIIQQFGDAPIDDVYSDEEKLEQIFDNILSNAIKFVDVQTGIIAVDLSDESAAIRIRIEDNGIGIHPEKLGLIFNRFEQAHDDTRGRYRGTGIGLAFARQLVQYLKGSIRAESEGIGRGTAFIVELPKGREVFEEKDFVCSGGSVTALQKSAPPDGETMQIRSVIENKLKKREVVTYLNNLNGDNEFDYRKGVIAIVDDDSLIAEIVMRYLSNAGYRNFILAPDSTRAMNAIYEHVPDLIICDFNMPDMRGDELHDKISANPRLNKVPFIFLSAVSDNRIMFERKEKGANAFLIKPIEEKDLLLTVDFHIKKHFEYLKILQLASCDELTGLHNRRSFLQTLRRELWARKFRDLSVIFFDLDNFKGYNDSFGHAFGDRLLQAVGTVLRTLLRKHDVAARYGGDEFVVVLPETGLSSAMIVAENLKRAIKDLNVEGDKKNLSFSSSFGIANLSENEGSICERLGIDSLRSLYRIENAKDADWESIERQKTKIAEILLELADQAMLEAKKTKCAQCGCVLDGKNHQSGQTCPACGNAAIITGKDKIVAAPQSKGKP